MAAVLEETISIELPVPPSPPVSWEAFLEWLDEDVCAEWVDGEVLVMSPSNAEHQLLAGFLYMLLVTYVKAHQLGEALFAPFLMRLVTRPSGRESDLLFIAAAHAERLRHTFVDGPADLAVEIVSPDSDLRDRGDKFLEYEGGGVPEYWLIDPIRQAAFFYQLGEDGHYHQGPIDADGIYRSAVLPGFWLRVEWLWQRPLPSVPATTRQLAV